MQFIIYILVYPFIWVISKLPFPLLYLFSDFVCFLVYTIFGYRKKVVRENIALTLPHLSEKEQLNIEKKFYHYMCDMFLEMMKTMSISQKEMEKLPESFYKQAVAIFHLNGFYGHVII